MPNIPNILQVTPGPTGLDPRVQKAMDQPTLNHLDPRFFEELKAVQEMLRTIFGTRNKMTAVLTGSGTFANDASVQNLVHAGDTVVVGDMGWFSGRIAEMAQRRGVEEAERIQVPWGEKIDPNQFADSLKKYGKGEVAAAYVPQVETSTGTELNDDDLTEIGHIANEYETPLIVDSVCAIGSTHVNADKWQAAIVAACSQKGINAPAGAAPITVNDATMQHIHDRKANGVFPGSLALDLDLIEKYFDGGKYHNTPPIQIIYGLRRALELLNERNGDGWDRYFAEQRRNQRALDAGMEAAGFMNEVPLENRAPNVSTYAVPDGNSLKVRQALLKQPSRRNPGYRGIEVALGKGSRVQSHIRVALLGMWSTRDSVANILDGFEQLTGEKALHAADTFYDEHPVEEFLPMKESSDAAA